jgi:RNA polymerase sigma-70 factor (ECF subfamily)
MSRRERHDMIAAALDTLDEVSRSAVVLRYYDGLSSKQIGELLDLAPAAVDMRLTRARRVLRDRLGLAELAPGVGK